MKKKIISGLITFGILVVGLGVLNSFALNVIEQEKINQVINN